MIAILLFAWVRRSSSESDFRLLFPNLYKDAGRASFSITDISDNRFIYPNGQTPKYDKFEITFQILDSDAGNFQLPYDPDPPNALDPNYPLHRGISVDAHFTPDDWQTVYKQPAFYYQFFDEDVKERWDGKQNGWFSPTDRFAWKVRFSPNQAGAWQYKLLVRDASGIKVSWPVAFEVVDSGNQGFIRVSETDGRYFEYDDGDIFYPLGFQGIGRFTIDALSDPIETNEPAYKTYNRNGINFVRVWISGMYGSAWPEWIGGRNIYDGYLPRAGITPFYDPVRDRLTMTQRIDYEPEGDTGYYDACRFQFWNNPEAIKTYTTYRLRIKYWGEGISGPREPNHQNFGLIGAVGAKWNSKCYEPGATNVVTNYGRDSSDWSIIEGTWNSGANNFVPIIYIGLENVREGRAFISSISLREELGNGQYGPEVISEPSMEYELYFPEQNAYSLDKIIEIAEKNGVYLKLVIHDRNDMIFKKLDDDGTFVYGGEKSNADGFYGLGRGVNKTRWLQQAWWRYLQARWGYSTAIHSWELTNEGDPWNPDHWAQTDEFGKYMHCRVFGVRVGSGDGDSCENRHPNAHLVTTSFWDSFPGDLFWANPAYPNVDYADVHAYVSTGWLDDPAYEIDAGLFHLDYSGDVRSRLEASMEVVDNPTKPIIRGETGIDFLDLQQENPDLSQDLDGVWLHNLIWASLDPGAMTDLLWYTHNVKSQPGPDGQIGLYEIYQFFRDFVQDIRLNNGNYQNAEAAMTDPNMRVTGQRDSVNGRAHLWVQNKNHTWRNVVDGVENISGLSGSLTIDGFVPNENYRVEWHTFTSQGIPKILYSSAAADVDGIIRLELPTDPIITDTGIKIGNYDD